MGSTNNQRRARAEDADLPDIGAREVSGYLEDLLAGAAAIASQKGLTKLARLIAIAGAEAGHQARLH